MTLNISYNWLKEYVKTNLTAVEFAKKLSLHGPSVDRVNELKPNWKKVVIGQIKEIKKHPDADKLSVCQVDVGEKNPLQIVCGAPNIKEGQKVPVVLVGGKVGEIEIKPAKIRGVDSEGMMCSQKELGLGEDHSGIYILPDDVKIGWPLEKVIPLDDAILEIEITSNRPDAMCVIGLGREASAILGEKFLYQEPTPALVAKKTGLPRSLHSLAMTVSVKEPKLCPRYQAIVMTDVKVSPSPLWMQQRLMASGLRPINNLVDITNYILLEFGQPMHVFDYDKLQGGEINVRLAKKNESILALDGKNYELTENNLVIADAKNPVAIAGVMGGELSAATDQTKTIVLESANFDPVSIRKTSRALNLHSESSDLFEKGLSPKNTKPALLRAVELVKELAGGQVASEIFDEKKYHFQPKIIKVTPEKISQVLGVIISPAEIKKILQLLGFEITGNDQELKITVPWWRDRDIEGEHDLVEEVARIHGYHNLPSQLMAGEIPVSYAGRNIFALEEKVKDILVGLELTEVYAYSFTSKKIIKNSSLDLEKHIKIANPLSADFEYLRTDLTPGLLQIISENAGFFPEIKIFELSRVFTKIENDLGREPTKLALAISGSDEESAFLQLKGILEALWQKINLTDVKSELLPAQEYWSAKTVAVKTGNEIIGQLGIINKETLTAFGLKKPVAIFNGDFQTIIALAKLSPSYEPTPKFPGIDLDLSMEINENELYGQVKNSILKTSPLIKQVAFLSVYQGAPQASGGTRKIPDGQKALAIRITYRHDEKTLELIEAQSAHQKVVEKLKQEYNIVVR